MTMPDWLLVPGLTLKCRFSCVSDMNHNRQKTVVATHLHLFSNVSEMNKIWFLHKRRWTLLHDLCTVTLLLLLLLFKSEYSENVKWKVIIQFMFSVYDTGGQTFMYGRKQCILELQALVSKCNKTFYYWNKNENNFFF